MNRVKLASLASFGACCALLLIPGVYSVRGQDGSVSMTSVIESISRPYRTAEVAAAASGVVSQRVATEGTPIVEGQCIANLDSRVQEKMVRIAELTHRARGELQSAKAELDNVRLRLSSLKDLQSRNHASVEELMRVRLEVKLAEAGLKTIEEKLRLRAAEYEKLKAEAEQYTVRAPFDGVLVEFSKEIGEYVGPVDPAICTVAELKRLSIEFEIPFQMHRRMAMHQSVEVLFVDSNIRTEGTIYYIAPYPKGDTKTYKIKVRVDNSNGRLHAGERCVLESFGRKRAPGRALRGNHLTQSQ